MKSILVPAMALFLALPMTARAGDLCLDAAGVSTPTLSRPVIIGRGFTLPKKNKCKPFNGVMSATASPRASAVTGTACTSFDGSNVTLTLTATLPPFLSSGARAGSLVHYSVALKPLSPGSGENLISAFLEDRTISTSGPVAVFECHNAFPDNL
jgi:hypothetical protein